MMSWSGRVFRNANVPEIFDERFLFEGCEEASH